MQKQIIRDCLPLVGALLYSYLFTQMHLGVNAFLWAVFILAIIFIFKRETFRAKYFKLIAFAYFLSALQVVLHHSGLAQVLYVLSFITLVGYTQVRTLRFIWYGLLLGIGSLMTAPITALHKWRVFDWLPTKTLQPYLPLSIIPLGIGTIFLSIYYTANPTLAALVDWIILQLGMSMLDFSWLYLGRVLLGACIIIALLWPSLNKHLVGDREAFWKMNVLRKRKKVAFSFLSQGLKREYNLAVGTLFLLNGLLLVTNLLDLKYLLHNFAESSATELSSYVHRGTNLLFLAIALAMVLVLYFFRRNLHFYPSRSPWLKWLAFIWLIQNGMLAISVALRNYYYFTNYGLTHLRIGVFVFLLVVMIGLFYTYQKVEYQKTAYYLFAKTAWAILGVLTITACFNWDILITKYNLRYTDRDKLDLYYLLGDLSDKNIYLLDGYPLPRTITSSKGIAYKSEDLLNRKKSTYERRTKQMDWRHWNLADARNRIWRE